MTKQVIMLKGLPGSGKSRWAIDQLKIHPGRYKRVNKDLLRRMFDADRWSPSNERFILQVRDVLINAALTAGYSVIVDDCNLHHKHEQRLRELAYGHAEFVVRSFVDVPLQQCIDNDLRREASVGEARIRQMYNEYIRVEQFEHPLLPDSSLPWAVIVDLDGTLALFGAANPYNREFFDDVPNHPVVAIVNRFRETGHRIIITSGRLDSHADVTERWLTNHNIMFDELHMRPAGDVRKDTVYKEEIYNQYIKGHYNIRFVLDDRDAVVEMWRKLGLVCLQVAPGSF